MMLQRLFLILLIMLSLTACLEEDEDRAAASAGLPTDRETIYLNDSLGFAQTIESNVTVTGSFPIAGNDVLDAYQFSITVHSDLSIRLTVNAGSLIMKLLTTETIVNEDRSEELLEIIVAETTGGLIETEISAGKYYLTLEFDSTQRNDYEYTFTLLTDPLIDIPNDQRVTLFAQSEESPICSEIAAYNSDEADRLIVESEYEYEYGICDGSYIAQCLLPEVGGNHYVNYFSQEGGYDYTAAQEACDEDYGGVYTDLVSGL